jgi:osmotically-inducible protein OsmY
MSSALTLALAAAAAGCANDDTRVTVTTQARVNRMLDTDSEVAVVVHDGVATLDGHASSDAAHLRALKAAQTSPGVQLVVDHITQPPTLTGGTVPK